MKINITKKQFLNLMKLVYLGNWMANAHRTGSPDDPMLEKYEELEEYIFSLAKEFGFDKYADNEKVGDGKYYPTMDFHEETDIGELIEEYDRDVFWEDLPNMLGDRDFYRKYTEEDWNKMSQEERFLKMQDCIIKWEEEIDENGVERLGIISKKKD